MTIEFYTNDGPNGPTLRRWVCARHRFEWCVNQAREAVVDGRPGWQGILVVVFQPFCGTARGLTLDAGDLIAYADGGDPPIGEL